MTPRPSSPAAVVTGGAGWLGRALLRRVDGPVRVFVQRPEDESVVEAARPDAETVVGDIRDPSALSRLFDGVPQGAAVFHTASVIHPERTRQFWDVNVGGTALVLDAARRADASRLVYVSSNSPFGFNAYRHDRFDEASPYRPYLGYGRSKMEAEQLVARAQERGELETVVVRCPWFYGPFQPERQTRFFTLVRTGRFPLCGDGRNRRSMVFTENLADGLVRAERVAEAAGRAYWVADAEPYTMLEILDAVKTALRGAGLSVSRRQLRLPGVTSAVAERADRSLQALGRYSQELHVLSEMARTIACSIDRARTELGYEPTVALREGMQRSVEWCLKEGYEL